MIGLKLYLGVFLRLHYPFKTIIHILQLNWKHPNQDFDPGSQCHCFLPRYLIPTFSVTTQRKFNFLKMNPLGLNYQCKPWYSVSIFMSEQIKQF